jgi:Na+/H+-dicarboxylate symporter
MFSYNISATPKEYPVFYVFLLFLSSVYLLITFKWSTISLRKIKRTGLMLAYTGRSKAAHDFFIMEYMEENIKREEIIAKQKKEYKL